MDQGFRQRGRAKAVAISQSVEARLALLTRLAMMAAGVAVAIEALSIAQRMWAVSHP